MLLTEKEAIGRWCPHNRGTAFPSCIASSCMCWRWETQKKLRDIDLVTSDIEEAAPRRGYCGLATKPEWE